MNEAKPLTFVGDNAVRYRGRTLLHFSGCDYFRLARSPKLAAAAGAALKQNGLNVAASRRTTGNHPIYARLEGELAAFFGAPAALLLPDGYYAPLAAAQALAGECTHAFLDELAHGALTDAARFLDVRIKRFRHRDANHLKSLLQRAGPLARPLILTDGMFAHDGSVAPLRDYLKLLPANGWLLVDDAHGAGLLGANGRGTLEAAGVGRRQIIQCATLSKAFGAYGGVVLGSRRLRENLLSHSRIFNGTTPLPPPLAGAGLAAVRILRQGKTRRRRLFTKVDQVRKHLREAGWEITDTPGPIIRLPPQTEAGVKRLKAKLLAAGIYPPFLKYSGASPGGAFRFVISSEHRQDQLDRLIAVLGGVD